MPPWAHQVDPSSGDFFVTGGTPPYKAVSSDPHVTVVARDANTGHFTVSVASSNTPCITGATIIVTDSGNSPPATVSVTTTTGTNPPAPPAMTVQPTTLTLACGSTGTITAVGGGGTYSATSTTPLITVLVSGHTISATLAPVYTAAQMPAGQSINVTDGTTIVSVGVTAPASCP